VAAEDVLPVTEGLYRSARQNLVTEDHEKVSLYLEDTTCIGVG